MTATARSNAACEAGVRARNRARSRSVSSRTRPRSMAAEVVAMGPEYGRRRSVLPLCAGVAQRRLGATPPWRFARRGDPRAERLERGPAGHGRQDDQRVGGSDRSREAVEHADVLVVEVDVDVAVQAAVVAEELLARLRMRLGERVEDGADAIAVGAHLALAAGRRAQDGWDLDRRHGEAAA